MISITTGRDRQCKANVSGVNFIYLFAFVKYNRSQIVRDRLTLTDFPETTIYRFEGNYSFNESQSTEDGGKFYTQNLTADFTGLELNSNLVKLVDQDYRVIIKDNNGLYRMLGTYNGVRTDLNSTTGGNSSDFSGYNLTFEGIERQTALFIDDLEDAGFIISTDNFLLTEDGEPILTEDNNKLIVE
jgi:hypothetical protein